MHWLAFALVIFCPPSIFTKPQITQPVHLISVVFYIQLTAFEHVSDSLQTDIIK